MFLAFCVIQGCFGDGLVKEPVEVGVPDGALVPVEADLSLYVVLDAQSDGELAKIRCGRDAPLATVAVNHA